MDKPRSPFMTSRGFRVPFHVLACALVFQSISIAAFAGDDDKPKQKPKIADVARADCETARRRGEISPGAYRANIAYLASDELEGRGIGSPGIDQAAEYISKAFKEAGLKPG